MGDERGEGRGGGQHAGRGLGDRVRLLRAWRNLRQDQLAAAAGLSRQAVNELEQGKRTRPREDTLAALARALDVTVPELLGDERIPALEGQPVVPVLNVPAGATVHQRTLPDGSVLLYIRAPRGRPFPEG